MTYNQLEPVLKADELVSLQISKELSDKIWTENKTLDMEEKV